MDNSVANRFFMSLSIIKNGNEPIHNVGIRFRAFGESLKFWWDRLCEFICELLVREASGRPRGQPFAHATRPNHGQNKFQQNTNKTTQKPFFPMS